MIEKSTAKNWITCFCEDIKEVSIGKENLYLTELRTMLAMFPMVELPDEELIDISSTAMTTWFQFIAKIELKKAKKDETLAILLSLEMTNKAVGLGNTSEEELKKIEEFLLQEIKTEQVKMGKTLEQTLREEIKEPIKFAWYQPFHSKKIGIDHLKTNILKSNVDERLNIYHKNVQKQRVEDIILQHYKQNGYTNIETIDNFVTTYFVSNSLTSKIISYTWTEEYIVITVQDM